MVEKSTEPPQDVWSEWLLHGRHGGDAAFAQVVRADVEGYANRVLDAARLAPGMTLADIGSGEGIIAFRAIERIGPSLRVLITDISAPMLQHVEMLARQRGVWQQCSFIACPADRLTGIADGTVDVVATRAVLAYVADKPAALREFQRILKPGGRLTLAEPILQDEAMMASALRTLLASQRASAADPFLPLLQRWKAAQYPDTVEKIAASPIVNYTERNLFDFVRAAGFLAIHLELHIDLQPSSVTSWDTFLRFSPHPWAPPTGVILAEQFSAEERLYFEKVMRPIVESPATMTTTRMAYLHASKPSATELASASSLERSIPSLYR
jgi:ubiquinone/menaquinone biosynthesis C-methylase UbiE